MPRPRARSPLNRPTASAIGRFRSCSERSPARRRSLAKSTAGSTRAWDSRQIDAAVRAAVEGGEALYAVDAEMLASLHPDIIITQDICRVCAVADGDLAPVGARVISLGPRTLEEVAASVRYLGRELGVAGKGEFWADEMLRRIDRVRHAVAGRTRPRVFLAEWMDPPFASGHWIPEMVEAAGGLEVMGRAGERSVGTTWEAVRAARPELVIAAPCGFDEERATREAALIDPGCPVVAVDADRFFVRPSPSLARGVEILARIFHGVDLAAG